LQENNLASAFEVYANGVKSMQVGSVVPYIPYTFQAFLISPTPADQLSTGTIVIALRVHISASEWGGFLPGLSPGNLALGREDVLRQRVWVSMIGGNAALWTWTVVVFVVASLALMLFTAQRHHPEYLWTFLLGSAEIANESVSFVISIHNLPLTRIVPSYFLHICIYLLLVLVYFGFVRQRISRWVWSYLAFASLLYLFVQSADLLGRLPPSLVMFPDISVFILDSIMTFIIPAMLFLRLRRGNREAGILLIPAFLYNFFAYAFWGSYLLDKIPISRTESSRLLSFANYSLNVGPIALPLNRFAAILCWLSLAAIMVLRFNRTSRQQAVLESEMAAAQEVQQVIIPEQMDAVPGFVVETDYRPALEVGGDFFQIIPHRTDGSLLIVAGDVTGHGLKAGMLVALLVGAIRTVADTSADPEIVLHALNERLLGRGHAGATCLALRITRDGEATLANAGHLPPYLNGEPVAMEGALPLGMVGGAEFSVMYFQLKDGDKLVLMSDGIVEATDAKGNLFGFERVQELLRTATTAADLASAAQSFGQEDDITCISVTRTAVLEPALA
jgi:hypothetical protein